MKNCVYLLLVGRFLLYSGELLSFLSSMEEALGNYAELPPPCKHPTSLLSLSLLFAVSPDCRHIHMPNSQVSDNVFAGIVSHLPDHYDPV
jgi:hypothetical protein